VSRAGSVWWTALAVGAISLSIWGKAEPRLVYNPSESAPRGWYLVHPSTALQVGDYVIAMLPHDTTAFASRRRYLPKHVPVLKQIAAVAGQRVCVRQGTVVIEGAAVATTLPLDGNGRLLQAWSHCRKLESGELFLLNANRPSSFDSRYFGPIDASFVRGKVTSLWTTE
jgi:conjugative transfer signal peptidase TraF